MIFSLLLVSILLARRIFKIILPKESPLRISVDFKSAYENGYRCFKNSNILVHR